MLPIPVACLLLWALPCVADDWPQFRRDAARSAASGETGITEPLSEAWRADSPSGSLIVGSPVVSDGFVLLGCADATLRCYDESSGLLLWTWNAGEPVFSTPLVDRGRVYVVDRQGTLACLSLETGAAEWTRDLQGQGVSSPTLTGNLVVIGRGIPAKSVLAVDRFTGATVWNKGLAQPAFGSPCTDGTSVWSISNDGRLVRVSAATGAQLWVDSTRGSPEGIGPALDGGSIYVAPGGYDTSLYRIDAASGAPVWIRPLLVPGDPASQSASTCPEAGSFSTEVVPNWNFTSSSVLRLPGGSVCVEGGITALRLFDVDEATGAINWALDAGAPGSGMPFASSPAWASGRVFVGAGGTGALLVVNPAGSGSIVQSIPMPGVVASSPAIANGRVWVASSGGRLIGFDGAGNRAPGAIAGGTMAPSGFANGPGVTLSWAAATDSGPGADLPSALRTLVRWDEDGEVLKDFAGEVLTAPGAVAQALPSYPEDSVITWRVRTLDTQGAWSPWSASATFVIYAPWRLQGRVTRGGAGVQGVTVTLSGSGSGTALTGANGTYNFFSVPDGVYRLDFSRIGCSFSPSFIDVTVAGGHELGHDAIASFLPIFSIRGRVTVVGSGVPGVTIGVTGDWTGGVTTDAIGNYAVNSLTIGDYALTPSAYGLVFVPPTRAASVTSGDVGGQDFTGQATGAPPAEVGGVLYPTIPAAVAAALPGQTVNLVGGTYAGPVDLPGGISLAGVGPHLTIIDGQGAVQTILINGNSSQPTSTISRLRVTGGGVGIEIGGSPADDPNIALAHLVICRNTGDGVHSTSLARLTGSFLTIANNGGDALDLSLASATVYDSILSRNGGVGVRNRGAAASAALDHPCIAGNTGGSSAGAFTFIGWHVASPIFLNEAADDYRSRYDCPTVDRARPTAGYAQEPASNGGRANQGAFGDTQWATTTSASDLPEELALGGGRGSSGWVQLRSDRARGVRAIAWARLPWLAYDTANGAIHTALGNVDGQPGCELILGSSSGGWLAVMHRVGDTTSLLRWVRVPWALYDTTVGVTWPACGDVDGDGFDELVVGLGAYPRVGGWVAVLDDMNSDFRVLRWLRLTGAAYNAASGETRVACGDVDGDGRAEIVVATGRAPGTGGFAQVFDDAVGGFAWLATLNHPSPAYILASGELWPAVGDLMGDGRSEVLLGPGRGGSGQVWIFRDAAGGYAGLRALLLPWNVYDSAQGEVRVACGNLDADARDEVVGSQGTYAAAGGWSHVWDDAAGSYSGIGWVSYDWPVYNAGNGEIFPAIGNLR